MNQNEIKTKAYSIIESLNKQLIIIEDRINIRENEKVGNTVKITNNTNDCVLLEMASTVIKNIIDKVSVQNINKVENLVNSALSTIFTDLDLKFKINQVEKRGIVVYEPAIIEDGEEGGTLDSYGGSVICVISFVLKVLFNILAGRYPLVVFDESLSHLASKYIPSMSSFMNELTSDLDVIILMVSHQDLFVQEAVNKVSLEKRGGTALITQELNKVV